jgi:hypothetical protein
MAVLMILRARDRILVALIATVIFSCKNAAVNIPAKNGDVIVDDTALEKQVSILNAEISVKNIDTVPAQMKYDGKILEIKSWYDKSGEHYVLITEKKEGEYLTDGWLSKLNCYMYTKNGDEFRMEWQVKDNVGISAEIQYLSKSLNVKDVDGDGEAEVSFFYSFNEDGADPMPLKMILYSKGKKLAIRGVIPRSITDLSLYKKTIDAKDLNREIVNYASKNWDKVAVDEMRRIIGEEVTQAKEFPIKE